MGRWLGPARTHQHGRVLSPGEVIHCGGLRVAAALGGSGNTNTRYLYSGKKKKRRATGWDEAKRRQRVQWEGDDAHRTVGGEFLAGPLG